MAGNKPLQAYYDKRQYNLISGIVGVLRQLKKHPTKPALQPFG